jgi:transposase InsO family protein
LVDHCALCVLNKRTPLSSRLKRWAIVLSEFDFQIVYTKGALHKDIDCLSRAPVDNCIDEFLEHKVYTIVPKNINEWISNYTDDESKKCLEKANKNLEGYTLKDGLIFHHDKMFIPASKRNNIIKEFHELNARHGGTRDTAYVMNEVYWPNIQEDINTFVRECDVCQRHKVERQLQPGDMFHFEVYEPNKQIAIDTFGPLTQTLKGNVHVVVAIDMFTRFVEAKPVANIDGSTFADFLSEYSGRYGIPQQILTDNGPFFKNALVKGVLDAFNIEHVPTTPRHSRGNAIVERVTQSLQGKLELLRGDTTDRSNWDVILPVAVLNVNTSLHSSLGFSPYELVFGRKHHSTIKNLQQKETRPTDLYAQLLSRQLEEMRANAITAQINATAASRPFFENKHRHREYKVGDLVLVKISGRRPKLTIRYAGPFKITERKNDIYKLQDETTNKTLIRHTSALKPYFGEPDRRIDRRIVTYRR